MRLSVILLAVFAILIAGCNPPEEEGTGTNGETSETGGVPVVLGFNLELTGNAASFGISAKKGAELAIEEINAANGILGRQIEAIWEDNASLPQQSGTVASKLIHQDKVHVLIGAVASSNSIAMARIAEDAGVPMVTPASTKPSVTLEDDGSVMKYVFRTCFTDDFQGEGIVDFAVNGPIAAKNACIFYDADNDYSVGIWEVVKRVAPLKNLNIVAEDSYLSTNEQDFRAKLNKFKAHEFDVLIVPGYYNQVAMIANQAREVGLDQPLLGGDGFDSPDLWKNAGANIEGSYFTNHYAADDMDPAVQGFIKKYKERWGGNVPDAMAILAYDGVYAVADAITRAGTTDPDELSAAIADTKDFKGAAGTITIDEKHNATKKLVVLRIGEGGALSWVYSYNPTGPSEQPAEEAPVAEEPAEEPTGDETPAEQTPEEPEAPVEEGHEGS